MIAEEIRAVLTAKAEAVATMVLDDHFALDGREIKATFKSLCVFTRKDGRWLWSAGQTMRPIQA